MAYFKEASKSTPKISFDPEVCILQIEGDSYPENTMELYQPLIDELDQYFSKTIQRLKVELFLTYTNTSSSKLIGDIIRKLNDWHEKGNNINLFWYYYPNDIECKEDGEIYLDDVSFPYQIVEFDN